MARQITEAEITRQLDAVLSRMESLTTGLSPRQMLWRPQPGAWGVAECLQHLNETARLYLQAMRVAFERERQNAPLAPAAFRIGFVAGKFLGALEPPYRVKVKAPRAVVPPADVDPATVMADFVRIRQELRQFVTDVARVDVSGIRFPSPFFGLLKFNLAEACAVILAHDRRHLWQAENVRQQPAFPKA